MGNHHDVKFLKLLRDSYCLPVVAGGSRGPTALAGV